jgi:hypothetical protein
VKDSNLCAGPITTDTDATDTDASAMLIAKMSEQEHIFYLLRGIPRNDEWKVILELMMNKNAMMTATSDEIVNNLIEKEATIKRETGLAPKALLFAKKGGKAGKAGKGSRRPKRDKRDEKRDNEKDNDRKEKDFRRSFHCQRRGHPIENCSSKQCSNPSMSADTAANASTVTTSTLTNSIENYWKVASSNASSRDWFIDCGCTTHISGHQSMFIAYTQYRPNTQKVNGYNGVTSFASVYGSVRLICQLPDGKTETIILQEVVHLQESLNLVSQSQIMDKDVKVEPVNHYNLNFYNHHGKLMATALQDNGLFVLDRV